MNLEQLDFYQRRLYELDKEIEQTWEEYYQCRGIYGDLKFGYNETCRRIAMLETVAEGFVQLLKRIGANI